MQMQKLFGNNLAKSELRAYTASLLCTYFELKEIFRVWNRVAIDLENLEKPGNLKETSESQGICERFPKVREFARDFQKSGNFVI